MTDILFRGDTRLKKNAGELLKTAGYRLVEANVADAQKQPKESSYCAAVVDWKSQKDKVIIRVAKEICVPVIVISGRICAAFEAGEPHADLYLEKPTSAQELVTFLVEMIKADQHAKSVGQEAAAAAVASR
jgi:DNA-binding response OmpR family regulator